MSLTLDEKNFVKKHQLSLTCPLETCIAKPETCQAFLHLRKLPDFVCALFNHSHSIDLNEHYVLLRNIPGAPYNYAMVYYSDRELGDRRHGPCPLNVRQPGAIFLEGETFRSKLNLMLENQVNRMSREKEAQEEMKITSINPPSPIVEEIQLLCEAIDLNMEMKEFVEKETGDSTAQPKPNIVSFGGREYCLDEKNEEEWKVFTAVKKIRGWKDRKII